MSPAQQALAILTALSTWCAAKPGRGFKIANTADGWKATLLEVDRRTAGGSSMTDAMAQIATAASVESEDGAG